MVSLKKIIKQIRSLFVYKTPVYDKILPESIRYALNYEQALLNKEHIKILNEDGFENEAAYLITKALQQTRRLHQKLYTTDDVRFEYLYRLVDLYRKFSDRNTIISLNNEFISKIPENTLVQGAKLAQLSRQGFMFWQKKYKEKAEQLVVGNQMLYLLANSVVIGLKEVVQVYSLHQKSVSIIFPKDFEFQCSYIGYTFFLKNQVLHALPVYLKDSSNEPILILDDTKNTGKTEMFICSHWKKLKQTRYYNIEYQTIVTI